MTAAPTRNVSVCEPQDLDRPEPEEELVIPNSAELIEMYAWNVIFGMVSQSYGQSECGYGCC